MSLKASRTPSRIDDISRILAGFDDDFGVPDWTGVLEDVLHGLHIRAHCPAMQNLICQKIILPRLFPYAKSNSKTILFSSPPSKNAS